MDFLKCLKNTAFAQRSPVIMFKNTTVKAFLKECNYGCYRKLQLLQIAVALHCKLQLQGCSAATSLQRCDRAAMMQWDWDVAIWHYRVAGPQCSVYSPIKFINIKIGLNFTIVIRIY